MVTVLVGLFRSRLCFAVSVHVCARAHSDRDLHGKHRFSPSITWVPDGARVVPLHRHAATRSLLTDPPSPSLGKKLISLITTLFYFILLS